MLLACCLFTGLVIGGLIDGDGVMRDGLLGPAVILWQVTAAFFGGDVDKAC